jgi:hypothetical protein
VPRLPWLPPNVGAAPRAATPWPYCMWEGRRVPRLPGLIVCGRGTVCRDSLALLYVGGAPCAATPLPFRAFRSCSPSFPPRPPLLPTTTSQLLVSCTRFWLTTNHKSLTSKSQRRNTVPPFDAPLCGVNSMLAPPLRGWAFDVRCSFGCGHGPLQALRGSVVNLPFPSLPFPQACFARHASYRSQFGNPHARVAELADAADLKSASRKGVRVRVPSWAPLSLPRCRFLHSSAIAGSVGIVWASEKRIVWARHSR